MTIFLIGLIVLVSAAIIRLNNWSNDVNNVNKNR